MTPAARLQAAIDLLDTIFATDVPADGATASYFRERRYIGAKDRRAVSDQVWRIVRTRAQLTWALGIDAPIGRLLVAADLARAERKSLDAISGLYSGAKNGPPPLSPNERRMVE